MNNNMQNYAGYIDFVNVAPYYEYVGLYKTELILYVQ